MANLRIIADNAIDRATLSASSTNGALAVTNLQSDKKSNVWQAVATSARLGAAWTAPEPIQAVVAPICNWSPTATWRVRLTSEAQATNLALYSQAFDNAAWAARWGGSATITANDATYLAPDGTQTVDKIVTTSISGAGQSFALTGGVTYTFSCWLLSPVSQVKLGFGTSGTVAPTTSTAFAAGTQLVRCSITFTPGSTATYYVGPLGTVASQTYYAWGGQMQVGAAMDSYYPTTSATAARPLGYIDSWQSYSYDSTSVLACPSPAVAVRGFTAAQAASAYAYGGGTVARLWLPASVSAYGMAIDIVDTNNLQGHLEAARLVCGPYWTPTYNASEVSATNIDSTLIGYTDAGDQWADAGTIRKKVPISLEYMPASDRATLSVILRASRAYPIFLSIFPEIADFDLERAHSVYGRRMTDSEVAVQAAIMYGTKLEVESI